MAIRDLLWACPLCGRVDGLVRARTGERCAGCGASFRRGRRSLIEVTHPDGRVVLRSAADWAAMLPAEPPEPAEPPASVSGSGEAAGESGAGHPAPIWRETAVLARFALGDEAIRRGPVYLGTMERLGPERPGRLSLTSTTLELTFDDGERHSWPLDQLAALQASSTSVQLRPRGQPIVSFKFPESSSRLWDESITRALRARWRALGRGEILEFQPRIVAATASAAGAPAPAAPPATGAPGAEGARP